MSNDAEYHKWNVICVKKFTFPMPGSIEFSVESRTLHGASMKACNEVRKMEDGWNVKSIYWLNPNSTKRGL